jgi:hypothetical protein
MITDISQAIKDIVMGIQSLIQFRIPILQSTPKNLVNKSDESILYFPVIISNDVEKESLTMITSAATEQYATLLQLTANNQDIVTLTDDPSADNAKLDFIKGFHTNIKRDVYENHRIANLHKYNLTEYKNNSLNFKILNNHHEDIVPNGNVRLSEAPRPPQWPGPQPTPPVKTQEITVDKGIELQDIKKNNAVTPRILTVDLKYKTAGNSPTITTTKMMIGIKTVLHLVSSDEIVYYIQKSLKNNSLIFKLIKWTTGEISLIKDMILDVDQQKSDALATRSPSKKIWSLLRRAGTSNTMLQKVTKQSFIPNATLVMSITEVERLKNEYNLDLFGVNSSKFIDQLMKIFMFMSVIVLNDAEEIAYFYNIGAGSFNTYTYKSLKDKTADQAKDLLKVLSMVKSR